MKKFLQLDLIDEESKEINNFIESEYTQLLENHLKFIKDDIMISTKGIMIHQKLFPFTIKEQIQILKQIGKGSAAKVHLVSLKDNPSQKLAMKTINIYDKQNRSQLLNDIKSYLKASTNCPFLVDFYGGYFEEGQVKLFLEYMDRGNLRELMNEKKRKNQRFTEREIVQIIEKIMHGLSYMHKINHQIHLDIKPENILLDSKKGVKISDFGITKVLEHTTDNAQTFIGTFLYMSPERLLNQPYKSNADIWSLGIMLYEMMVLEFPFNQNSSYIEVIQKMQENSVYDNSKIPLQYSSSLRSLLKLMLVKDPVKRQNSYDLIVHKVFFNQLMNLFANGILSQKDFLIS